MVPYPLPLERPPIAIEFTGQALLRMVSEEEVETVIRVRLSRDNEETIREALAPESVVVMSRRGRWRPIPEWMLAWWLRRIGIT